LKSKHLRVLCPWIREGKLKVNSDWNKDLKIKFTVQDPCQIVRKSFGDPIAEDLRFVVKSVVGEENFIDMQPNRSNNFCCGGGGGFLQSGFKEERLKYGKLKDQPDQGHRADYCIAACHNCHAQIHELSEHYGANYLGGSPVDPLICLSLGILGPNEREYLGDDLKKVNVFHPELAVEHLACEDAPDGMPGSIGPPQCLR
jgi:Fe-S oxidoreductase